MKRRDFIKSAAGGATVLAIAPVAALLKPEAGAKVFMGPAHGVPDTFIETCLPAKIECSEAESVIWFAEHILGLELDPNQINEIRHIHGSRYAALWAQR